MKKIINEFKEFIERGNVIDLAVGVVMGSAFSKIVSSVVDDLLMPVIGVVIGGIDFSSLKITFKNDDIRYGLLLNNIIQRRRKSEYEFTPSFFCSSQADEISQPNLLAMNGGITGILMNYNYAEVTPPVQTT